MKRTLYILSLALAGAFLGGCSEEEIVFDHELPAFETKENSILLEVIAPKETTADAEIYIAGAFNGGEEAAVGNMQWQLEKSTKVDGKYGIYLDPTTFVSGKTLADGYYFVSSDAREERSALGESVLRTDSPAVGTRTNIYVTHWAAFFDTPVEPETPENVNRLYVLDNTGWEALALYSWYSDADGVNHEIFGSWPGAVPTGEETIGGDTYKYFDLTEDMVGQTTNLIFNNNNGGSQFDAMTGYVIPAGKTFFSITSSTCEVIADPTLPTAIYVADNSGWEALALYSWFTDSDGVNHEIFGSWPGAVPDGEMEVDGVTYKYFLLTDDMIGQSANLIFNNNNGGKQFDAISGYKIEGTVWMSITDSACEIIGDDEGGDEEEEYTGYSVYVEDLTSWGITHAYGWSDAGSVTPSWPGVAVKKEVIINGYTYKCIQMGTDLTDKSMNLILNGNSSQLPDYAITLNRDYYFSATNSTLEEVDPEKRAGASETFSVDLENWSAASTGGSQLVRLSAISTDWTVSSSADWLTATDKTGKSITSGSKSEGLINIWLSADPNVTTQARTAEITFTGADATQTAKVSVSQGASKAAFLSQWVFNSTTTSSFSTLWQAKGIMPATTSTAGSITVKRGDANASTPFTYTMKGNNPSVGTMVKDDYWLFTFSVDNLAAGSVVEFDATMAGDKKSPKYYIVEWYDGGTWKSSSEDLRTASEDASVKYTFKCSGEISTGSTDTYQYTTVLQACKFDNAVTSGEVKIRCRAVGDITCDGSKQDISATSSNMSSLPDFGFTAVNVQNYGTSTPSKSYNVLVLGNSFSYYFNPVFMLKEIAWSQGKELKITAHLKGSQRLHNHSELEMSQDAIKKGGYDFAIIQDQSTNPAKYAADPTTNASVSTYCNELVAQILQYSPSCKIILDQTWAYPASEYGGYGSYEEFDKMLQSGTKSMAENANTWIAPVGEAFAASRAAHSGWSLYYSGDSKHPTRSSAYLKACVEYVTMFGEKFTGTVPACQVNSSRATYFQGAAESLIIGHESDYRISR